ncbi:MAG: cob(I)yrinic acid a,c-diamide adenosyltransferase, partial [Christensenellaceae bacterium]|nr:cob(I)yrinic acid a,c-diamide adenosyltransferase [Christensenellaceae bacterium]
VYFLIEKIDQIKPETIILDELAVCTGIGLITEEDMWNLIDKALSYGETIVTGRYAPQSLIEKADYVSEIVKKRHPFDKGIPARKGVEW